MTLTDNSLQVKAAFNNQTEVALNTIGLKWQEIVNGLKTEACERGEGLEKHKA